jgi:aromatic ring-opening dioxygenase catalytic subunit (LigB family)
MNQSNVHSVIFLSHGGGPLPLLGDQGHIELIDNLKQISSLLKKPSAIIVISAHWEEKISTITHAATPALIYDYSGFPQESYSITYPAKGAPSLADELYSILKTNNIDAQLDDKRGFDHGMFVPLKIMYPDADIPCIQVSLLESLNPAEHIRLGEAIAELKHEGLLVIGSGFSFHNMRAFFTPSTSESRMMNEAFEKWLIDTCTDSGISENERAQQLIQWEQAPYARYCHPREEHLLPLHVCYGIAKCAAAKVLAFNVLGIKTSAYVW